MTLARSLIGHVRAAAVALALVALLAACSGGADQETSAPPAFNAADVKFAQTMIPHHEQAVEMSEMLLAKSGVDPQVTAVAQRIKDTQGAEIGALTGLLAAWNQPRVPDHSAEADEHHWAAEGVLTPEEMQELDAADGPTGQLVFLEGMIEHHKGAVTMVQDEIDNGENPDAVRLAQAIKDGQTAEVQSMTTLLGTLADAA
jgi:uncharacterized protein (DUF305 family)